MCQRKGFFFRPRTVGKSFLFTELTVECIFFKSLLTRPNRSVHPLGVQRIGDWQLPSQQMSLQNREKIQFKCVKTYKIHVILVLYSIFNILNTETKSCNLYLFIHLFNFFFRGGGRVGVHRGAVK